MKKYQFEYCNQKFTSKLMASLFVLFLLLFSASIILLNKISVKSSFLFFSCVLVSFSIPYIIYRFNKKKIKKQGSAIINESDVEFDLDNTLRQINYTDIKSYLIQNYNGSTLLNLVLRDGEKCNIATNGIHCDTDNFDAFCKDFEQVLEKFNENKNSLIVRKKTFFEKAWVKAFLVILTIALGFMIIYGYATGKKMPLSSLLMVLGPLSALWGGCLNAKNRKKN